jgi:hypothetical protein
MRSNSSLARREQDSTDDAHLALAALAVMKTTEDSS